MLPEPDGGQGNGGELGQLHRADLGGAVDHVLLVQGEEPPAQLQPEQQGLKIRGLQQLGHESGLGTGVGDQRGDVAGLLFRQGQEDLLIELREVQMFLGAQLRPPQRIGLRDHQQIFDPHEFLIAQVGLILHVKGGGDRHIDLTVAQLVQ